MLVMHATTQMIPKCILLIEKKQDPIGYILFDSVHMTLWKGKATEMETILAHPDNQGLRGGGVADYKKDKQWAWFSSVPGWYKYTSPYHIYK